MFSTNIYLSKFNAYNMNAHTHTHSHTHRLAYQGNETEEKVFKKRKVFKEDLKELTEVEHSHKSCSEKGRYGVGGSS